MKKNDSYPRCRVRRPRDTTKPELTHINPFAVGDKVQIAYDNNVYTITQVSLQTLFGVFYTLSPHPLNDSCYQYTDALKLADIQL